MSYEHNYGTYQEIESRGSSIRKTWLYFLYYWVIFGIGTYLGQFVPPALYLPITIGVFAMIMISLFTKSSRKFGGLISNLFAFLIGILSYTSFMYYLGTLGTQAFYGNIALAIGAFAAFGIGLFLLYTVYDFNRMKRGQFSPREMGFNLFINLLNIIMHILRLASILRD